MGAVVAVVRDLLDRSRIASTLGPTVHFVSTVPDASKWLTALEVAVPITVVVDLRLVEWESDRETLAWVLDRVGPTGRVVGFGPHVEGELLAEAQQLGLEAMARSLFFSRLGSLLG